MLLPRAFGFVGSYMAQIGPNWSKLAQVSNSTPTERDMTSLVSLTEQASRRAHGVVGCSESF